MERLRELNERQREAVLTLAGPVLVLAGAGTGKTRVITHRAAELIHRGTPPSRILSVTFTNKAAREMQQRTAALLGRQRGPKPLVSTFHALCVRILRQEAEILGYPSSFAIYDRSDQESAARAALREIRVTDQTLRPAELVRRIGRWKTKGVVPETALEHAEDDLDVLAAAGYRRYQRAIRSRGAVDFDDLLLLTRKLFDEHADVLARHQSRFDHVQIDEFQDTNDIQFALIEALVRPHRSIYVVGDDDQSIYGFRGAQLRHILDFERIFEGTRLVRLEQNYRSNPAILEIANRLSAHNPGRHEKSLRACKRGGSPVRLVPLADERAEAAAVVGEIARLIREGRATANQIAILVRTNEQPRLFESELRRLGVRYVVIGSQSFYDRREIRDLLAYLKVLARPHDESSLLRIINRPPRGIGDGTVEKLTARAVRDGCSLWDAVPRAQATGDIPLKARAGIDGLRSLLDRFREQLTAATVPLPQLFDRLLADINYLAEIERTGKDSTEVQSRQGAIGQLREAIVNYSVQADTPTLSGFLDECALSDRDEEPEDDETADRNAVRLMTLHSAKGLEFPRVYLVGLEEGLLPHRRAIESSTPESIAEERRLAYVGITRAMDHLTITWSMSRTRWGKRSPSPVSRFVFEMRGDQAEKDPEREEPAPAAT